MSKNEFYIILGGMFVVAAYFLSNASGNVFNSVQQAPGAALQSGYNFGQGAVNGAGNAIGSGIADGAGGLFSGYDFMNGSG